MKLLFFLRVENWRYPACIFRPKPTIDAILMPVFLWWFIPPSPSFTRSHFHRVSPSSNATAIHGASLCSLRSNAIGFPPPNRFQYFLLVLTSLFCRGCLFTDFEVGGLTAGFSD